MRSLLVFLHLVVLTRLSEGAPVPQGDITGNVKTTVDGITCDTLQLRVADADAALAPLQMDGTRPAGLDDVSDDELLSLLKSCPNKSSDKLASPESGRAADGSSRLGGSGSGSGDSADGNGDPSAYKKVAYPSSADETSSSSAATSSSSAATVDTPASGYNPPVTNSNIDAGPPTGFSSPSYPASSNTGDSSEGAVSGTSGYPSTVGTGNANVGSGYPSDPAGDGPAGSATGYPGDVTPAAAPGYPTTFTPPAKAGYTSFGNGDGDDGQSRYIGGTGGRHNTGAGDRDGVQRISSSGLDGTCSDGGAVCTNVAATSDAGTVETTPTITQEDAHVVPGSDMKTPVVKEVNQGCPNETDVKACVDDGKAT